MSSSLMISITQSVLFKPALYGAYSELFAAFSPTLKAENNGGYVMAWGRLDKIPDDIAKAMKGKENGETPGSQKFWDYCQRETKDFV
jgi:retinol dehydrogenase-12